jgi:uncharacterized SAM-binding protein YcdF (DUF218 family)
MKPIIDTPTLRLQALLCDRVFVARIILIFVMLTIILVLFGLLIGSLLTIYMLEGELSFAVLTIQMDSFIST